MAEIEVKLEIIDDVIPLYPDLVAKDFKEVIIEDYNNLIATKEALYNSREYSRRLEKTLKQLEAEFNLKSQLFDIKYKTDIKQGVTKDEFATHVKGKVY